MSDSETDSDANPDTDRKALFLRDHPSLRPYVLSNIRLSGVIIGMGLMAASTKFIYLSMRRLRVHDSLVEADSSTVTAQFAKELQLMATLRHKNVVNLLGIYFFPGLRHLTYFTMDLKCSILQDVANGLAYLHEQVKMESGR